MKILFLNSYYEDFLKSHYAKRPKIDHLEYWEQWYSVQDTFFGDSDFYSHGMSELGWEAHDLITNCPPLQKQWAKEHDYAGNDPIWIEQIRQAKPDVVYTQGLWLINNETYLIIKQHCKLIVGQVGSKTDDFALNMFDLIFTSVPQYVDEFRKAGVVSYYLPLAFDKRVWERVKGGHRIYPITFVGYVTAGHKRRADVLRSLKKVFTVHEWIGELWGIEMFQIFAQSMITINCNIDFSQPNVGNMRLFEGTGCGAAMVTDHGDNLHQLFGGNEIKVYTNPDEAVGIVDYLLKNKDEREALAKAGQERTFMEHSYLQRMVTVSEILEGML